MWVLGRQHYAVFAVSAASVAVWVCGCAGYRMIPKTMVEQQIVSYVNEVADRHRLVAVNCPQDLPARVGDSMLCAVTTKRHQVDGVTYSVTRVRSPEEPDRVWYHVQPDSCRLIDPGCGYREITDDGVVVIRPHR